MFELKTSSAAILLLILTVATTPSVGLVEEALDIIKLGKDVTVSILETWDIIEQTHLVNEVDIPFYKKKEKKILSRMTELSRQIDMAELEVSKFVKTMQQANLNKCSIILLKLIKLARAMRKLYTVEASLLELLPKVEGNH